MSLESDVWHDVLCFMGQVQSPQFKIVFSTLKKCSFSHEGIGRHNAKLLEDSKLMLEDIKYLPLARQRTKVKKREKIYFKYLCLYYARNSAQFVSSFVTEKLSVLHSYPWLLETHQGTII